MLTANSQVNSKYALSINYEYSTYFNSWSLVRKHRSKKHIEYIKKIPFSDFKVFNYLLKSIPNKTILQLGNSSAVRYAQLFNINPSLQVFCNRGTSGIDGSTSTDN